MVKVYTDLPTPDFIGLTRCLAHLHEAAAVVEIFQRLLGGTRDDLLIAFQVGFDLVENTTQSFLGALLELLKPPPPAPVVPPPAAPEAAEGGEGGEAMEVEAAPAAPPAPPELSEAEKAKNASRDLLVTILTGEVPIALCLEFLFRANRSDLSILTSMRKVVDQRSSLLHSGIIMSHAIISAVDTKPSGNSPCSSS